MMNYKCFAGLFVSIIIIYCFVLFMIDPLGMLNIVNIKGFNHYKGIQDRYIDVWKPYEIQDKKPDVVFIGSSRVYYVIDPRAYQTNAVVYNAGFSSLSLKDMDAYIDMICAIKTPKIIYIGLDLFQFGNENFQTDRSGFSTDRINNVSANDDNILLYKFKDTLGIEIKNIKDVIKNSKKNVDREPEFINGYYNNDFNINLNVNKNGYYGSINGYNKTYKNWKYSQDAIECLQNIIEKAQKNNIEVVVYFNPTSVELMDLMRIHKVDDDLEKIKREVADICGTVYDFNFVNGYVNDKKYFVDSSHVNRLFGELVIQDLQNKHDSERMLVLTNANIDEQLAKERKSFAEWKNANTEYHTAIENAVKDNKQVKVGDFKKYIGF